MADVIERVLRRSAPLRDPRETLEPLLDELMRSLGFERAAVLVYDEDRAALAGRFGIGVPDAIARELVIPVALADDPIVAVLRGGPPERIRDATTDERISPRESSYSHVLRGSRRATSMPSFPSLGKRKKRSVCSGTSTFFATRVKRTRSRRSGSGGW